MTGSEIVWNEKLPYVQGHCPKHGPIQRLVVSETEVILTSIFAETEQEYQDLPDERVQLFASFNRSPFPESLCSLVWGWPDFGIPYKPQAAISIILNAWEYAYARGWPLEIGCTGGHGRTGTMLAIILVHAEGLMPEEAISAVREEYCPLAIETAAQEEFVFTAEKIMKGL